MRRAATRSSARRRKNASKSSLTPPPKHARQRSFAMNQQTLERYQERYQQHVEKAPDLQVARTLGWVSLAIGLTELIAPKKIEQTMGLRNGQNTGILRMLGIREIMHGVDILAHRDPTPGLWARV